MSNAQPNPHEQPDPREQSAERQGGREMENENLRVPDKPGEPPRPATEPPGSEWSVISPDTATDPGSGEPIGEADAHRKSTSR